MLGLRLRVGEAARRLRARHLDLEESGSGLRRRLRVRVVHYGCVRVLVTIGLSYTIEKRQAVASVADL